MTAASQESPTAGDTGGNICTRKHCFSFLLTSAWQAHWLCWPSARRCVSMAVKLVDATQVPGEASDKIMALVHGYPGVGKTGFALSFPGPIWMYNLDRAIGHFASAWASRELTYEKVAIDVDGTSPAVANQYLLKFDALVREAVRSKSGGTFIVDGWDIFWDIVKIAKVQNLDDSTMAKEYGPANEYMNNHLRRLGLSDLNVVFTTMSKKIWTGMKTETDRVQPEGFKYYARMLTHEIYMYTPDKQAEPAQVPTGTGPTGQRHEAYIARCKLDEKLIGQTLPNLTFATLYKMTFKKAYPDASRLWSPIKAGLEAQVPDAKVESTGAPAG